MELPAFVNPAEFVIDMAAVDNRTSELEAVSTGRVKGLKTAWRGESAVAFSNNDEKHDILEGRLGGSATPAGCHSAFGRQVRVLTARTWKVTYRDPMGMGGSIIEAMVMGVMTGWVFLQLRSD
jgi:hypothetical protein